MPRQRTNTFTTIRSEGGLLPSDLLAGVAALDKSIPGLSTSDYHLVKGESLGNRITESWNKLNTAWRHFNEQLEVLPESDQGTTLTRDRWLQPLFGELGFGRLQAMRALEIDGKSYPVSHGWGKVPIHLISCRTPIDRRSAGVRGAAGASPHSMVQEVLNRSQDHLWAFVSNGLVLRILRDNASLTRQAYVEFDLESMMADGVYEDFVVLWLACHQSRIEADDPKECWLEKWTKVAADSGTRARDDLRAGVEKAIEALGAGFVAHPSNSKLREKLRSGELSTHDYYRQLLRVIYRLLFLFVAEDRQLLHPPSTGNDEQRKYARYYSLGRIRTIAGRRRGGPHPDLWSSLVAVFQGLGRPEGIPSLGLPGLGSFLWSDAACPDLVQSHIANQHLLSAVRDVGFVEDKDEKVLRPVDYRNLGSEELGAVYESLLEQHPEVNADAGKFALNTAAGNERKTTGSYYTPTSLITELLNSAVDPVVAEAAAKPNPEEAILSLSVIDPACGSGHFLIAAAHRIAKRLATLRTGDDEPSPDATRTALRDVISHCIYGIDLNPMAVELCKVSLWVESMEPGKPLGFLDHRIVRGNGLIGATPKLLEDGVPGAAFAVLTGDDKAVVSNAKKYSNKAKNQPRLFVSSADDALQVLSAQVSAIESIGQDDIGSVERTAKRWAELLADPTYQNSVHAADTWCAAFVAERRADTAPIGNDEFLTAKDSPSEVDDRVRKIVESLRGKYAFLHWHLAFPSVFTNGGFDIVLGNPPWERVKLSEKEFFASRAPEIAKLAGAKRKSAIARLKDEQPFLWDEYQSALRESEAKGHFIRNSGRFPLCGRGDVNTYAVFAEVMRDVVGATGRVGMIVPTGIATDDTTRHFFADIVNKRHLASLFDFENRKQIFEGIHRMLKFCLMTLVGRSRQCDEAEFVFFAYQTSDLLDHERRFTLSPEDLSLINPNTKTAPIFRTRRDASIVKKIYQFVPPLSVDDADGGSQWGVYYLRLIHYGDHAELLRTEPSSTRLRVYEAKAMHQFDHRWSNITGGEDDEEETSLVSVPDHSDPAKVIQPRYWLERSDFDSIIAKYEYQRPWLLGYRDITNVTNERTAIASVIPYGPASVNMPILGFSEPIAGVVLLSTINSFILDYIARQAVGGSHLTFGVMKQLPFPVPNRFDAAEEWSSQSLSDFIIMRAVELSYTAWDLKHFGADLGYHGSPFKWDPQRRELIRAELDAMFFRIYGIERDDVDYIMDTFPIVRRKDEAAHGEYRTKRLILERFDALAEAAASGTEYQTVLNPPPADPSCAHPESTRPEWA